MILVDDTVLRHFDAGRSAARNDKPRSSCTFRPEGEPEAWAAWQAGHAWESRDDGPFTITPKGLDALNKTAH